MSPLIRTWPVVGVINPIMHLNRVDFPDPFMPINPHMVPPDNVALMASIPMVPFGKVTPMAFNSRVGATLVIVMLIEAPIQRL